MKEIGEKDLYQEDCFSPDILRKHTIRIDVDRQQRLKSASSSNGNQMKWYTKEGFVKADCLGYEALAEMLVCWLLKYIRNFSFAYVRYYPCCIYENGIYIKRGCFSKNYMENAEEVTFGDLLNANLRSFSISYDELRELLLDETGIDVKSYLDAVLCLDSITRNEDRHFHNLAFLSNASYRLGPVFDNGAICMSDQLTYPMDGDFHQMVKKIYAKPFSVQFKDQIRFADRLLIDVDGFFHSVVCGTCAELQRAFEIVWYGLQEMRGISWEPAAS